MLVILLSLVAGFLSVLAPCILPLLPIIIGGSITSDGCAVTVDDGCASDGRQTDGAVAVGIGGVNSR